MTTQKGYKKTAIGIIPEDWEVKKLGELGVVISGLTFSPQNITDESGVLVLRSSNVQDRGLKFDDNIFVDIKEDKFNPIKVNDILICVRNGSRTLIGKNALINANHEGLAFGAFMSVYRSNYNEYLFQLFDSDLYYKQIYQNLGATINSINESELKNFSFPVPPLPEQKMIADVLTTWDKAIKQHEELITQKELRKKWLMQQLLTGKKRLEGGLGIMQNEIKKVKFGNFAKIKKGKAITSSELIDGDYPVIAGGQKSPYKHNSYTHENVITISASGAYAGFIAFHKNKIWASDCSVIEEINGVSTVSYLYYVLLFNQDKIYKLQTGGAQPHVYPNDIYNLSLIIHNSIEEQAAIAHILQTADKEIRLLKSKTEKLRKEKKWLMQMLLTGKKRLIHA